MSTPLASRPFSQAARSQDVRVVPAAAVWEPALPQHDAAENYGVRTIDTHSAQNYGESIHSNPDAAASQRTKIIALGAVFGLLVGGAAMLTTPQEAPLTGTEFYSSVANLSTP